MKQLFRWGAAVIVVLSASGCGLIKSVVMANEANRLAELEKKGDYEALAETCRKPTHDKACKAMRRVALRRLEDAPCENLLEHARRYYRNQTATKATDLRLVRKFRTCKLSHELFAQPLHIRWIVHAWTELDRAGESVFDSLVSYFANNDGMFGGEEGGRLARGISKWLVAAGDASRCAKLDPHMNKVRPESRGVFLWFYAQVGCAEQALPMALDLLTSRRHGQRVQACEALGKFGDASVVNKLEVLASTDPYKQEREVRTRNGHLGIEIFYPVRERCLAAAGRVRLRT